MGIQFIIFDLDKTLLCNKTNKLYKDVKFILRSLKKKGYKIGLASYNAWAEILLEEHDIYNFFDYISYEDGYDTLNFDNKLNMLTNLISNAGVKPDESLFFDDQIKNLLVASGLGIKTRFVDPKIGITKEIIMKNLDIEM